MESRGMLAFAFLGAVLYLLLPLVLRKNLKDEHGNPLPPGPPFRYPFLRKYNEQVLHKWAQQYGGLFSVWMGQQLFVVINDPIVARDLLVVNGANFSSRWNYFVKNQIILEGRAITATPYNAIWYELLCTANAEKGADLLSFPGANIERSHSGFSQKNPLKAIIRCSTTNLICFSDP